MATPFRRALSAGVGWLADRRVPRPLRAPIFGVYCRVTGADASEAQLPLSGYPSLGAFFVRRLGPGMRPLDPDPASLLSPCDGRIQTIATVREGRTLQAKGHPYSIADLLAGAAGGLELEGASLWTIYLSPRDYHRVHSPLDARLIDVRWVPGERRSVAPRVATRRDDLYVGNERAVLALESAWGPFYLVMVGALNVGRIRVVGVPPGSSPRGGPARPFARGQELARFEMGSTVVLLLPPGAATPLDTLRPGTPVRLGQAIGRLAPTG